VALFSSDAVVRTTSMTRRTTIAVARTYKMVLRTGNTVLRTLNERLLTGNVVRSVSCAPLVAESRADFPSAVLPRVLERVHRGVGLGLRFNLVALVRPGGVEFVG
jgi:hypothetical protein